MLHKNRVFEKIGDWHAQGRRMVLACVVATEGSTYSKAGDFIVIADNGDYQGLVSGGCVEGDLAERARHALSSRRVVLVNYDLGGEHDALWGMGAGCEGALSIALLPICSDADRATLLALRDAYVRGRTAALAVRQRDGGASPLVAMRTADDAGIVPARLDDAPELSSAMAATLGSTGRACVSAGDWFVTSIATAPRVLICGAAPDAHPLCGLLAQIGWSVSVYDHRPAYIDALSAVAVAESFCAPASALSETVRLDAYDAVVIMSHHLASDERYLAAIAATSHWHYIGVLGPRHRRDRLVDSVGGVSREIEATMHGPAGLDIGAKEPASIALSIVAQMQSMLAQRGRL